MRPARPDGHEADGRQRRAARDDLPSRQVEAGHERPRRGDPRDGHAHQVHRGQGARQVARRPPQPERPADAGPGGEKAEVGDREPEEVGDHDGRCTTHTPGASSVAPAGAAPPGCLSPHDPPVGAGAGADRDPRKKRRVRPEGHPARIGVELVGVARRDRRPQEGDRVHEPLGVDRARVLDRRRRQAGVMPRARRKIDRRDREPRERHEGDGRPERLHHPARPLALELLPDAVGECDADRLPGKLGEQSGRHPAMILDPVRASVSVVAGVAGRRQRLLLAGSRSASAAGS